MVEFGLVWVVWAGGIRLLYGRVKSDWGVLGCTGISGLKCC